MSMSPAEQARIEGWEEDVVNSPSHYTVGGIEAIDVLEANLTTEQFRGYLLGNALKYLQRCNHKGNFGQDVEKAEWYLNRLKQLNG